LAQCAGVGCGLVHVVAGEERARKVFSLEGPPGDGEKSRLGSRDSGTRCEPHSGETNKMKLWTIEPVHGGGRVKRLRRSPGRARGVGGFPTKPSEDDFLVWASKPCSKAQHDRDGIQACREASKWRTCGGISWLASGGRGVRQRRGRPMERPTNIT
jgi:hypothetical protein